MTAAPEFELLPPHRRYVKAEIQPVWNGYSYVKKEKREYVSFDEANLISSLCIDKSHAPTLDLDFACTLVPSTTPGHFHLYLNKSMKWRAYRKLLKALYKAGIVERGFYKCSKQRKQSQLRLPHVKKES